MNVERVQKISELAMDLMKQGLVPDKEEAIKKAEELLSREDYSSLRDTVDEVKEGKLEKETAEESDKPQEEITLNQTKIKEILKKNVDFTVKTMKNFQEQIDKLGNYVEGLKSEMSNLSMRTRNIETRGMNGGTITSAEPKKESVVSKNIENGNASAPVHPRSGNYVDNDVSIEKFFYSGSKPKD